MPSGWLFALSLLGAGTAIGAAGALRLARARLPGGTRQSTNEQAPSEFAAPSPATAPDAGDPFDVATTRRDALARLDAWEAGQDRTHLLRVLRDVQDGVGAEEAIFWRWRSEAQYQGLIPVAWTADHLPRPTHFRMDAWGPLVQWAAEERMVQCGGEGEHPAFAAAPVLVDDVLMGVVTVTRDAGLRSDRTTLRAWLPRHASQLGVVLELSALRRRLSRHSRRSSELLTAVGKLQRGRLENAPEALCTAALDLTGGTFAAVIRWDAAQGCGVVQHATMGIGLVAGQPVVLESLVGAVCDGAFPVFFLDDARALDREARLCGPGERFERSGSLAIAPLRREGQVVGSLIVAAPDPGVMTGEEAHILQLLEPSAVGALAWAWQLEAATELANRDRLTGLHNRRHFDDRLKVELAKTNRYDPPLSLIVVDIDHFKQVNDTHGHEAGDAVLRHVARILADGVREVDLCARYGGEEIAILLPHTPQVGAFELAERLRRSIESRPLVRATGEIRVTASFGVASFPESVGRPDELFPAADRALYEAKHAGRNQVRSVKLTGRSKRT